MQRSISMNSEIDIIIKFYDCYACVDKIKNICFICDGGVLCFRW